MGSFATQQICTIMAMLSEQDQQIIELIPLFIRQWKVGNLRVEIKDWHRMSISQLAKFKSNEIVNPEVDFAYNRNFCKVDVPANVKVLDANPEFDEALRKLEIVKKAHVAGEQFQAAKDTKVVSDFRRKNPTEDMKVLAKKYGVWPKEPEHGEKLKENAKHPWKGYEKKPKKQTRKKAGEDTPLSKTNTTTSKAEQKKNESKKVAPKMEVKKNEAPKIEPLPQLVPLGRVDRKNCKPLVMAPNSPVYFPEIDLQSKVLQDAFTVFTLMCDQFDKFFVTHKEVWVLVNETAQQASAITDREIFETVGFEYKTSKSKKLSEKTENPKWKDAFKGVFDASMFFDDLVQLRAKCDPKDKELYNLLEEQERIRALLLHSAAKNYLYFFDKATRLNQAILPGETPLAMRRRHWKEGEVTEKISTLAWARRLRINPVKKAPVRDYVEMKKTLPHPTGPDEKMEKKSKNKNKKK
ncbi:unnamed protein product [Caenorhabditis auriculariae]|uniref:Uncharacterized protein n=1 Tax=Caenorhabditis auriculariae TaxID=2777116 RepID=A0A8S1HTT1_9PELO|nr:unnamed protein product [Caenorhabditis auriculariae]